MKPVRDKAVAALELVDSGISGLAAARMVGIGENTLYRWARRLGRPITHYWLWPESIQKMVARLYGQGFGIGEIERMTAIRACTCWTWAKRWGCEMRSPQQASALRYSKVETSVPQEFSFTPLTDGKAWLLGLIYSDGCIVGARDRIQITVGDADSDAQPQIDRIIGGTVGIGKGIGCSQLQIYSRRLCAELTHLYGLVPAKGKIMTFPEISGDLAAHFVRGLFDGDGCWWEARKNGRRFLRGGYRSASRIFVEKLATCIKRETCVRGKMTTYKQTNASVINGHKVCSTTYSFTLGHHDCVTLGTWMYKNSEHTRYNRKFLRWFTSVGPSA